MTKRTLFGFKYDDGTPFTSFRKARKELLESLVSADENHEISLREQKKYVKHRIKHCKDGAYL